MSGKDCFDCVLHLSPETHDIDPDEFMRCGFFGTPGAGKSTGAGVRVVRSFLASIEMDECHGVCSLLGGESDQLERWIRYAKSANREDDLMTFSLEGDH